MAVLETSSRSLKSISSNLSSMKKNVLFTKTTTENLRKVLINRTKIKSDAVFKTKYNFNKRLEASKRREAEDMLEASDVSSQVSNSNAITHANSSSRSPLGRILSTLGYLTAGWLVKNLPTWIGMAKEFIGRIYKGVDLVRGFFDNVVSFTGGIGNIIGAYATNLASFDFFDTSRRVNDAFNELNTSVENMNTEIQNSLKLISTPLTESLTGQQAAPPVGSEPGQSQLYPESEAGAGTAAGPATDLVSGAKAFMSAGFPAKGAAYLAGNAQQESGWAGQRGPWTLNDGAGTNKGIMSWNRGRITRAEKFLGKPLNKASNAEQIRWVKYEMQQSYSGAYKIFMNPNASDADLQKASYIYLGYGDVGSRFAYAQKALKSLQTSGGSDGKQQSPTGAVSQASLPKLPPTDTLSGGVQRYGASRDKGKRKHAGVDFDISGPSAKFYSRIGGVVVGSPFRYGDDGWAIDIHNKGLGVYERIAEASKILVKSGQTINPGQPVAQGESRTGVIHYEIRKSIQGGFENSLDPMKFLSGAGSQVAVSAPPSGGTPGAITPDRRGQTIIAVDNRQPQSQSSTMISAPGQQFSSQVNESGLLNRFIKNKFLTDLAYL